MKIHSGLFFLLLCLFHIIISDINSCSALTEAISLMLAMKLCSGQLRHQNGPMTARPHALGAPLIEVPRKKALECFHLSTKCFLVE